MDPTFFEFMMTKFESDNVSNWFVQSKSDFMPVTIWQTLDKSQFYYNNDYDIWILSPISLG